MDILLLVLTQEVVATKLTHWNIYW